MSGKLDQSLDDIVKTERKSSKPRSRNVRRTKVITPVVVGGISKSTKGVRNGRTAGKIVAPVVPISITGESKIVVSGLPTDVTETQIKEYFAKTIGPIKRVFLTYGPNGQSRGVATIVFTQPGSAADAATKLNGVKVDGRAMKIEVIMKADQVAPVITKKLGDRIAQPKSAVVTKGKPKTVTTSNGAAGAKGRGAPAKRGGRNAGRGKPKTADELDAEMTDYFVPKEAETNGAAVNGAPAAADASMDDQIM